MLSPYAAQLVAINVGMCECVKEDCRECGNKLSNQMAERPDG